jgi:hypothetical protein
MVLISLYINASVMDQDEPKQMSNLQMKVSL